MIDHYLRIPFEKRLLHILRFLLRGGDIVAIQIETKMIETSPDRPRLAVFDRVSVGVSGGDGVVPGDKAFVPVGIFAGDDQHDRVFQNVERLPARSRRRADK